MWFERGAESGDRECHNGLGIMWRDGLVKGRQDIGKALAHFSHAAGQELAEALVNMGKHHYGTLREGLHGRTISHEIKTGEIKLAARRPSVMVLRLKLIFISPRFIL